MAEEPKKDEKLCPRCKRGNIVKGRCNACNYASVPLSESDSTQYIALYGITQSGKTVFLASLIKKCLSLQKTERKVLLKGWRPFVPIGELRTIAFNVCRKVAHGEDIDPNERGRLMEFSLDFTQRVCFFLKEKHTFRSHDVSGEDLKDWVEEHLLSKDTVADLYLHAAQAAGIIILIDPTHEVKRTRWAGVQDELWRALLDRLLREQGKRRFRKKPILFILTKSDTTQVSEVLKMPSFEKRFRLSIDETAYQELIKQQDKAALQFVQRYMKQIFSAIDPTDRGRAVRKFRVIAMSSMGLNQDELEGLSEEERDLHPWRITEPFVWMLDQLRPWHMKHIRDIITATLVSLVVMASVLIGIDQYYQYQGLWHICQRAREQISTGKYDQALNTLAVGESFHSWLLSNKKLDSLREEARLSRALNDLNQYINSGDFDLAARYIRGLSYNTDNTLSGKSINVCCHILCRELHSWLTARCKPLVDQNGNWADIDYNSFLPNADLAARLFPQETWVGPTLTLVRTRKVLVRTWELLSSWRRDGIVQIIDWLDQAEAGLDGVLPTDRNEVFSEIKYVSRRLTKTLLSVMAGIERSDKRSPQDLHDAAKDAHLLLVKPWATLPEALKYWRARLSARAHFEEGQPQEAIDVIANLGQEVQQICTSDEKRVLDDLLRNCYLAKTMLFVPRGVYSLGSSDPMQSPQRTAKVEAYYIDQCEATNAQFHEFLTQTDYEPTDTLSLFVYHWEGTPLAPSELDLYKPVSFVSGEDAVAYANWIGKQIPTEDEWEVAAGWDKHLQRLRRYPYGDNFELAKTTINTSPNEAGKSPIGCLDTAGGLWEWVLKLNPSPEYVLKGGCGHAFERLGKQNLEEYLLEMTRVTARRKPGNNNRSGYFGFRCVLRIR